MYVTSPVLKFSSVLMCHVNITNKHKKLGVTFHIFKKYPSIIRQINKIYVEFNSIKFIKEKPQHTNFHNHFSLCLLLVFFFIIPLDCMKSKSLLI